MYVECPHCQALFRITKAQLEAAEGWVRCGECGHIFEAGETLSSPEEQTPQAPEHNTHELFADTDQATFDLGEPTVPQESPPESQRPKRRLGGRSSTLLWSAAILVLIALLGLQYLLSQRDQFARYPELRPVLAQLCRVTGCELPPQRDLAAIELSSRNVFTHPNIPHALMVTATMINNAPFPQPYPMLQISFSNLDGQTVALGRFKPTQYLPKGVDPHGLMPVGKPLHISFSVDDPGQQALAYEFSFR
ncbi:MAG: DUF3426 domain-containing protein [Acidihalobacter sp.]|jgi:predicted Zn finger-like uncharacterized protein|uniref:DUF3426 domain-containing protein n=1 Tax=Acidihalobacter sp. TaxID=1872108 RepID=UPI00307F57BE